MEFTYTSLNPLHMHNHTHNNYEVIKQHTLIVFTSAENTWPHCIHTHSPVRHPSPHRNPYHIVIHQEDIPLTVLNCKQSWNMPLISPPLTMTRWARPVHCQLRCLIGFIHLSCRKGWYASSHKGSPPLCWHIHTITQQAFGGLHGGDPEAA